MIQIATRAQRDLPPYVSPKAKWDQPLDLSGGEVGPILEVEKAPSNRHFRRIRQRDLAAMGRKSRRKAARADFQQRQAEQSLRGQARVYLDGKGTPAMQETVRREIHGLAEAVAKREGEDWTKSIKRVEGELMKVRRTYGDDL